jgi:hypothetical protein
MIRALYRVPRPRKRYVDLLFAVYDLMSANAQAPIFAGV